MTHQHRLYTEEIAKAQHNRLQAQAAVERAAVERAAVELKWKEWWQPAKPPKLEEGYIATVPKPRAEENMYSSNTAKC